MKLFAIITTYYPDLNLLKNNISAFCDYVDDIYIWDNTPGELNCNLLNTAKQYKAKVFRLGNNVGLSVALNICYEIAKENGATHLLTMDQDSVWEDFEKFKKFYLKINKEVICGPSVNLSSNQDLKEEYHIITSGTIIPISILKQINGYCECFKIDGIDMEICDRARSFGYKVYSSGMGKLSQNFGDQIYHNLLGRKLTQLNYSVNRIYETAKSLAINGRAYKQEYFFLIKVILKVILGNSLGILIYENKPFPKIKARIKGFIDGIRYNLDKLEKSRHTLSQNIRRESIQIID